MSKLAETVREDIVAFLNSNGELLFNERDFQIHLAVWLKSNGKYCDVDVEYYVPRKELVGYVWDSELKLDIVVKKYDEYLPIELKYKTKSVKKHLTRFGENIENEVYVLKNQGAQDLGMYDFWKDVRRIEIVRNRFAAVKGGLAVFITNDDYYLKSTKPTTNHYNFIMTEGEHATNKHWVNEKSACAKKKSYKSFDLERKYNIRWHNIKIDNIKFNYCIVTV